MLGSSASGSNEEAVVKYIQDNPNCTDDDVYQVDYVAHVCSNHKNDFLKKVSVAATFHIECPIGWSSIDFAKGSSSYLIYDATRYVFDSQIR
jgi:hypothetical protein